jgi:uncharacterized protein YcfL
MNSGSFLSLDIVNNKIMTLEYDFFSNFQVIVIDPLNLIQNSGTKFRLITKRHCVPVTYRIHEDYLYIDCHVDYSFISYFPDGVDVISKIDLNSLAIETVETESIVYKLSATPPPYCIPL